MTTGDVGESVSNEGLGHASGKGDTVESVIWFAMAAINFAMAAINVPFIVANPTGAVLNWVAAVFCFGQGVAFAAMSARR